MCIHDIGSQVQSALGEKLMMTSIIGLSDPPLHHSSTFGKDAKVGIVHNLHHNPLQSRVPLTTSHHLSRHLHLHLQGGIDAIPVDQTGYWYLYWHCQRFRCYWRGSDLNWDWGEAVASQRSLVASAVKAGAVSKH
jgi:hypothetical protein